MENDSWSHGNTSAYAKEINARSAFTAEWETIESEVWNQIRRTEEDSMEMGTMEPTLLRNHCILAE